MMTSIRSFAMSLSFFSSLTRHCWSVERNPRPFRAANSSSYFLCSSWSLRNSWFSWASRSIKASVSGMRTSWQTGSSIENSSQRDDKQWVSAAELRRGSHGASLGSGITASDCLGITLIPRKGHFPPFLPPSWKSVASGLRIGYTGPGRDEREETGHHERETAQAQ